MSARRGGGPSATPSAGVGAQAPAGSTVVRFPGRSARRRRAVRWALAGTVLALLGALAWGLFFSPVLAVDEVTVTGTRHVEADVVHERLAPLYGVPLPRVGTGTVRDLVNSLPGVAEVRTVTRPPTGVEVVVREHDARAQRSGEDGRVDLLLADGSVLSGVAADLVVDERLPEFSADLARSSRRERAEAADVVAALPSAVADRVVDVDSRGPGQVRLGLSDGVTLVWGDAQEMELKGTVALAFLEDGRRGSHALGVAEIDVSVPARPITR